MKNLLGLVVLAAMVAGGCSKKEKTGGGTASAPGPARDAASSAVPDASAAPPVRADVAAFAAIFDPVNSRLDHVARARTACEQRRALVDAANAIDKTTPPAGREAQAWLDAVEQVQVAIDEMGDPCDEGNIKAIEAKLDNAKKALEALTTG